MIYLYHFLRRPDLTRPMPGGLVSILIREQPEYEHRLQCETFGFVRYKRPLSSLERAERGLVDDSANYLPFVRRE